MNMEDQITDSLQKRAVKTERRINKVRIILYFIGFGMDFLTAWDKNVVNSEYLTFLTSYIVIFSLLSYLIHLHTKSEEYKPWSPFLNIFADQFIVISFYSFMQLPEFRSVIDPVTLHSIMVIILILLNLLNSFRYSVWPLVYTTVVSFGIIMIGGLYMDVSGILLAWSEVGLLLSSAFVYWISRSQRNTFVELLRRSRLQRFLSKELVEMVESGQLSLELGGTELKCTVLLSDIRGFTTLSESLSPTEMVEILNEYFSKMSGIILEEGGMIDKYIGDAILATFGAPLPKPGDTERAIRASIRMLEALKELNESWKTKRGLQLRIGIALHTGPLVAGTIGSPERMEYTVIGDTVNVASRLEGLNKEYSTQILFTEPTIHSLSEPPKTKYLGEVELRGRKEKVKIYTLEN